MPFRPLPVLSHDFPDLFHQDYQVGSERGRNQVRRHVTEDVSFRDECNAGGGGMDRHHSRLIVHIYTSTCNTFCNSYLKSGRLAMYLDSDVALYGRIGIHINLRRVSEELGICFMHVANLKDHGRISLIGAVDYDD